MTHEREQSHASASHDGAPDRETLEPGRSSRSALMRKPDHAIASGLVQRAARDANGVADGADQAVSAASSSSGAPLPETLMRKFEGSLGADLGGVRVHTGEASATANDAVGAKAYTMGNDIHFGAGQYDPSSVAGEHLLAHEVAHTVQQSGSAQRMQFKLAVSSPGDHLEHEADTAASAMVSGTSTSVTGASGLNRSVIQREEKPAAPPLLAPGAFTIGVAEKKVKLAPLGPFKFEATMGGSVQLSPAGGAGESDKEGGGTKPIAVGTGISKEGPKVGAEKEFGDVLGFTPKMSGEVGLDKNGKPKLSVGFGISHPLVTWKDTTFGPVEIACKLFEWSAGAAAPEVAMLEVSVPVSTESKTPWFGFTVKPILMVGVAVEPDYAEIGKWIATEGASVMAALAAGAAAAIAAPFVAAIVMGTGWGRAGHEFDEVQRRIEVIRAQCQMASKEAMTGVHMAVSIPGVGDVNAGATAMAAQLRTALAAQLKFPEGAFPAMAKAKPGLEAQLYKIAWGAAWGALRPKLLDEYKDTTFTKNEFERNWIETFDTGSFSEL